VDRDLCRSTMDLQRRATQVVGTSPWDSGIESGLASLSLSVIVRRDDGHEPVVKENDNVKWSSDDMVLSLGRKQK
jgi:hypothetical protein